MQLRLLDPHNQNNWCRLIKEQTGEKKMQCYFGTLTMIKRICLIPKIQVWHLWIAWTFFEIEKCRNSTLKSWRCSRPGSNRWPSPYQSDALPTALRELVPWCQNSFKLRIYFAQNFQFTEMTSTCSLQAHENALLTVCSLIPLHNHSRYDVEPNVIAKAADRRPTPGSNTWFVMHGWFDLVTCWWLQT